MSALNYLTTLSSKLRLVNQRVAVQLQLNDADAHQLLTRFIEQQNIDITKTAWLGGNQPLLGCAHYTSKQGQRLLGQEVELLVVDFSSVLDSSSSGSKSFDANSFNAALGALVGGGILFIINFESLDNSYQSQWLAQHFKRWPCIDNLSADDLSLADVEFDQDSVKLNRFEQQAEAVAAIEKVVTGHRRRPLVLNANRGRGKTASLGIAAAKLMSQRVMKIVITAPSINALNPFFEFADKTVGQFTWLFQTRTEWHLSNGSQLRFIAPDELNISEVNADLVLVDEAAALPLPMLKSFVNRFHRLVFSSTIHGYEGCGRGFSIKFMQWLNQHRPGWKHVELTQPIRWAENDPLENWSFDTFLLNADDSVSEFNLPSNTTNTDNSTNDVNAESLELSQIELSQILFSQIELSLVSKQQLIKNSELFHSIFGLLVTAHYQTTPNDVMQVLASDEIQVYQISYLNKDSFENSKVIGCLLVSMEGGLDSQLIKDIQLGVRRPKGHLAAAYLTNHLAMNQPAEQTSARIMRIAIDPTWQGYGVGSFALQKLQQELISVDSVNPIDFISVSFGATAELINFWKKSFQLVSIGTRRDHASGCYSAFMVQALSERAKHWVEPAALSCLDNFQRVLPLQYQDIEHETLASLLFQPNQDSARFSLSPILSNFSLGGNSFESVVPWYSQFVIEYLSQVNPFSELAPQQSKLDSDGISVVIDKVLLFHSWQAVAAKHKLAGRKQVEQQLRQWLKQFTV
ncbi:GNAT family N-acetyltransferase [Vibrio sp. CK2-1]|uniref:GNAT family N-acetyltransferase n=1 Tax=Vibrio sp. CK2-1 TaxID=2912249 RepID=UPI001F01A10E|nr:GNAT family N-acetyltransferase [Vibrio sp. CK2-1]MCF7352877.1 GNAT family N-acetyltransferase [Vibrio sp. CK2-1]